MEKLCGTGTQVFSSLILALALSLGAIPSLAQGVSVTTWHNDEGRTGQNSAETALTASNVNQNQFGLLCKINLSSYYSGTLRSGQIYAQPLVVADSTGTGMTVYVVTMDDVAFSIHIPNGWNGLTRAGQSDYDVKSQNQTRGDSRPRLSSEQSSPAVFVKHPTKLWRTRPVALHAFFD
jgi:hypothetical protein